MTVICVTGEAQQPGVGGAPGLVADTSRGKHRVEVLHQFAGELVGLHTGDARGGQQFGGGSEKVQPAAKKEAPVKAADRVEL